jgi:hypothetical protein
LKWIGVCVVWIDEIRRIDKLKNEGIIECFGSDKTGGYKITQTNQSIENK